MSGERSEKASEQRKQKSREKGEGVRSRELTNAAAMVGGLLLLRSAAEQFAARWSNTYTTAVQLGVRSYDAPEGISRMLPGLLLPGVAPIAVVLAGAFFAAIAVGAMQTSGVQIHGGALAWKPGRLNPATNIKNLFSARSILRFAKSLIPAAAVTALASIALRRSVLPMPVMSEARLPTTLTAAYGLALEAAWISLGWSAIDYVNEWRSWNTSLKMTKEEVKQEMKESNGNPHTKGRIRQIQRAMRRRRVKADLSKAAVVITNPTHYAVALQFDFTTMAAPQVLMKGRDLHALEIREEARWAGVPIVENPPLARALYRSVDEGRAIPFELYSAVAAILAFFFRESQQRASHATRPRSYGCAAPARLMQGLTEYAAPSGAIGEDS
jgi:flagellar biosynthetic protein FlhB